MNNHYFLKHELKDLAKTIPMHSFVFNISKYVIRYEKKGSKYRDIEKALDYLSMLKDTRKGLYVFGYTKVQKKVINCFIYDNDFSQKQIEIFKNIFEFNLTEAEKNIKDLY